MTAPFPGCRHRPSCRNPATAGDDERSVGFGVLGPPSPVGITLALRMFPRDLVLTRLQVGMAPRPGRGWTFYATTPGPLSCARYFSSATTSDAVQCGVDLAWVTPSSLYVGIGGLLEWHIDLRSTFPTRLMSAVGERLPAQAWTNPAAPWRSGPSRRPGAACRAGPAIRDRTQRATVHDRPRAAMGGGAFARGFARSRPRTGRTAAPAGSPRGLPAAATRLVRGGLGALREVRCDPSPCGPAHRFDR